MKKSFNSGKWLVMTQIAARLVQARPELADNRDYLRATMVNQIPRLKDIERCPNCDASMMEYIFEFDCLDAVMLLNMGKEVKRRMGLMDFTIANQVRVQELENVTYAMKSRTTQMSKLGLITQLREKGKRVPGVWVITSRGFAALKGLRVPKSVKVWRNRIESRTDETITISEAFNSHKIKVEELIKNNKQPKVDHREQFKGYRAMDWYKVGEAHKGNIF